MMPQLDKEWYRRELAALNDADLAFRAVQLLRIEAAHGDEASGDCLIETKWALEDRGLGAVYELAREHVRGERAKGRGTIHKWEMPTMKSELTTITTRDSEIQTCGALPMSVLVEQLRIIQEAMSSVMVAGTHYGVIPGTEKKDAKGKDISKPTLYKPGAEKLALLFQLSLESEEKIVEMGNGHREYRIKCRLKSRQSGQYVGEGVGSCSTMESKYRWRTETAFEVTEENIPQDAKEKKAEYRKQGYGMKKVENEWKWVRYTGGGDRVENPDIADCYNTCLKMAFKRSMVAAVITATAASDIFAQDLEDLHHDAPEETRPAPKPAPRSQGGQHASPPTDEPRLPKMPENGQKLYEQLDKRDIELTKAGKCKRGDLLRHVGTSGIAAGMPKNMGDWKGPHIAIAVGMAKVWIQQMERAAAEGISFEQAGKILDDIAASEPPAEEGYAGQEVEEPATA